MSIQHFLALLRNNLICAWMCVHTKYTIDGKRIHYKKKIINESELYLWEEITYYIETLKAKLVSSAVKKLGIFEADELHSAITTTSNESIRTNLYVCHPSLHHIFNTRNSNLKHVIQILISIGTLQELLWTKPQKYSNKRKHKPKGFSFTYSDDTTVTSRVWLKKSVSFV